MIPRDGWIAKRARMRLDVARSFSERSGIACGDFLRAFYDASPPPLIGDFLGQYVPDAATLDEMLEALARCAGVSTSVAAAHFSRRETFPQFAERLLRAGAYEDRAQ